MDRTQVFKLVWRGWFVGVSVVFTPLLAIAGLARDLPFEVLVWAPVIPLVAAGQGVLAGALVVLGLTIWPPKPRDT